MIRSIRHKGLKSLCQDDDHSGVFAEHVSKLRNILARLASARTAADMDLPKTKASKRRIRREQYAAKKQQAISLESRHEPT